jgi:proteasome lid subunit RPN8/RPN11
MNADSAHSNTAFKPPTSIVLVSTTLTDMHSHASAIYPEECCGLLLGTFDEESKNKRVVESKRMGNVFVKEERYHRYTIDSKEFMATESEAESRGMEIVGIYHSHPNAPAKPSQFDMNHAWPSLSYIVIEVRDSKPVDTKSWLLMDDRSEFVLEEMKIEKK